MLVEIISKCYAATVQRPFLSEPVPSVEDFSLVSGDYLVREHGANALEVWYPDISEHYLITLNLERQLMIDVLLVTSKLTKS